MSLLPIRNKYFAIIALHDATERFTDLGKVNFPMVVWF